jgi:Ca2+:H+ antiporter
MVKRLLVDPTQRAAAPRPRFAWLLIMIPVSAAANFVIHQPLVIFAASAISLIPLSELVGIATDQAAMHAGPRTGGLLNASLANVTELILSTFLVLDGQITVVKASLTGAILGNLLLVLGMALFAGGRRGSAQRYNAAAAGVYATSLALAVTGFLMPSLFILTTGAHSFLQREVVSGTVAAILMLLYVLALMFTRTSRQHVFHAPAATEQPTWSYAGAVGMLAAAAGLVALESWMLAGTVEPALSALHISQFFAGLIIIPLIGNVAEHSSAVRFALQDKVEITLEIAIGSSTQIALFVAPALVFISLVLRHPMDFVFSTFELATVGLSTFIVALISLDGRSNWLEGAQLVAAYLIIAASAFFVGAV